MKLLVTGATSWKEEQLDELRSLGHEITYVQDERISLKNQDIDVESIEGIIGNGIFLYNEISEFKNLKYIQLTSAGFDRAPMDYIQAHAIEIHNARGVYSIPMAEFVLCGVLQLYKQSKFFGKNQMEHQWVKHRNLMELCGKQVCILGCGSVGMECAKRFQAFGCEVIGINHHRKECPYFDCIYDMSQLDVVLSNSDIVVLSLPLTEETKHLINQTRFECMKEQAILVNVSRGAIVDTEMLIQYMPKLGGAVLDVFEEEPLPAESKLWEEEKVILTPHNSFVGEENRNRLQKVILSNLEGK